jgi:hypothetical protein
LYTYINWSSFLFRLLYVLWSKYIDDYVCVSASYNVRCVSSFFLYGLVELLKKYIYIESERKIISGLKKTK